MKFQSYLAAGFGLWLGMQAMINIGVNMGVLPTKGLTLPLMSYGRSSLIVTLAWLGMVLRVHHEVAAGTRGSRQRHAPRGGRAVSAGPVMIMAGGTGGHVFPALALARVCARAFAPGDLARHAQGPGGARRAGRRLRHRMAFDFGHAGQGTCVAAAGAVHAVPFIVGSAAHHAPPSSRRGRGPRRLRQRARAGLRRGCARRPLLIHEQNAIAGLHQSHAFASGARGADGFPGGIRRQPQGAPHRQPGARRHFLACRAGRALRGSQWAGTAAGRRRQSRRDAAEQGRAAGTGEAWRRRAALRGAPSGRREAHRSRAGPLMARPACRAK
jgi:hypothetical protein